jgi:EAL domain-containing protein (putative c-di-GMP-specific phosphodiesterase class I)
VDFHPVFQPVIALDGGDVHGYEALTRFASGRRPDLVFEDAHSVGLGIELETACAVAAVRAAVALSTGPWLGVNFSPAAVIAGASATVAELADRPLVVEITEHVEVESYAALRAPSPPARGCGSRWTMPGPAMPASATSWSSSQTS